MKVICDRGALLELLSLIGGVVAVRTPKPVLTCVKMTASGTSLTLAGSDTEIWLKVSTNKVEVTKPGEALVPCAKLIDIVRESLDSTLTLEVEGQEMTIKGRDARFKVFGHAVSEFPTFPSFNGEPDFQATASDLHRLVSQTIFATARENNRYAFNGVLVEREGNKLNVVATDGRRLALARGTCKPTKTEEAPRTSAIVPAKAFNMLLRVFTIPEQQLKVRVADNQIFFATDEVLLTSNLVEGNFPPYRDVLPKDTDKKATVATDVLASAVRRTGLLTNDESKGIRMSFKPGSLVLTSRAPEMGEAEVNVDLPSYQGEPIEIGFNPQFILDALKVVREETVQMEFKGANKPSLMRTGQDFVYVIMPVSLQ